jgi:hypothetical protein
MAFPPQQAISLHRRRDVIQRRRAESHASVADVTDEQRQNMAGLRWNGQRRSAPAEALSARMFRLRIARGYCRSRFNRFARTSDVPTFRPTG